MAELVPEAGRQELFAKQIKKSHIAKRIIFPVLKELPTGSFLHFHKVPFLAKTLRLPLHVGGLISLQDQKCIV